MSAPERSFGIADLVLYFAGAFIGALAIQAAARAVASSSSPALEVTDEKTLELRRRAADAIDAELVGEAGGEQ